MPLKPDPIITAINRYRAASAELTATQPTTVAGAIALIKCYLEIWSEHPIKAEHQASGALKILRSFLRSIAE